MWLLCGTQLQTYNAHKVIKYFPTKGAWPKYSIYRLQLNGLGENVGRRIDLKMPEIGQDYQYGLLKITQNDLQIGSPSTH